MKDSTPPGLNTQAFWLILARMIGFICLLAMPIVMARVFDKPHVGIYKQAFLVVSTAVGLCQFGVALSVFYFLPRLPERRGAVVLNVVLYHLLIGGLVCGVFFCWPNCFQLILGKPELVPHARIIGLIILTWLFALFLEFIPSANADVKWSTIFIIGSQISRSVLLAGTAMVFHTLDAVLYGALAQGVLQCLLLLWYLNWKFPSFWRQFHRPTATAQLRYAAPFGCYGILSWAQDDMHNYLVSHSYSTSEFATYSVGTSDVPLGGILRDSVNTVLLPRISKLQHEGKSAEILELLMRAWRKLAAAMLPAAALLLVLGRDFLAAMYTPAFLSSWPIFALNLSVLVMAIFLVDPIIRTHEEARPFFLKLRVLVAAIQLPVSLLGIHFFGMIGALAGLLVVSVFERSVALYKALGMVHFRRHDIRKLSGVLGFAVAAALAAGVTWMVRTRMPETAYRMNFLLGSAVYAVAYAVAVAVLGLPDAGERTLVNRYSLRFLGIRLLREKAER